MKEPRTLGLARALSATIALIVGACTGGGGSISISGRSPEAAYGSDTTGARPSTYVVVPMRARKELVESSAAAVSDDEPGVVFTINDSGNDPMLFALDTTGADRGAWMVDSAENVDWEAAAVGPCRRGAAPNAKRCVYVGDTGDNAAIRSSVAVYRMAEPAPAAAKSVGHLHAERLVFRYPDDPHDVEAMYVAPDTSIILISKRPLRSTDGRLRPALVFRLPASAWHATAPVVADLVDSLPIVPGSAPWRTITDAALSPDARYLAVRTYAQVYVFATDSASGRVRDAVAPAVCNIFRPDDDGGEGIGWMDVRTRRLIMTSEGRTSPLRVVSCPLPGGSGQMRR